MKPEPIHPAVGTLLTAAAVTGFIANSAINEVDELLQANIEALAEGELPIARPIWLDLPTERAGIVIPTGITHVSICNRLI